MVSFRKYFAEFLGTLILVLLACGTAAVLGCKSEEINVAYLLTALSFGLVLAAMAYAIGPVSGCHINPAVSFGMLLIGKLPFWDFCGYLVAQFAGANAGSALLSGLIGIDSGLAQNKLYEENVFLSILVETILTFVFVLTVLGVSSKKETASNSGLVIGLSLTLVHIFGIYFTGTSVNPARSFGPAIFVGGAALTNVWVFLLSPMIGALLASMAFGILRPKEKILEFSDSDPTK